VWRPISFIAYPTPVIRPHLHNSCSHIGSASRLSSSGSREAGAYEVAATVAVAPTLER